MKKVFIPLLAALVLGLGTFLGSYISTHNMGIFNPKGSIAASEMNLIMTAIGLMLIVVIPVFIMLATFAWRYRAGNTKAKYTPDWHENKTLEIIWWTIPGIIITILATITWTSSHTLDPFKPLDSSVKPITIQAVALDWKWLFIYPEQNIASVNLVQFPVGTPVNFQITADAPMNSFWIPQLAGQIYAMAGMSTKLHLVADEAGDYRGMSSNYSGFGFSGMKFIARATSQEEFDQWVNLVRQSPVSLSSEEYAELAQKSRENPVTYYSSVAKDLYGEIIMKFMMPAGEHLQKKAEDPSHGASSMPVMPGMVM
ncbi:MAG: ubiquinol oxidase subunit II [Candidatus Pacebacteria bacterium]|jgi:cytochrome o ubiquinol oxidase subunit 2|nr:ubiquinol oxidase subunit II [Candidatus Paceibacterota bacterium]